MLSILASWCFQTYETRLQELQRQVRPFLLPLITNEPCVRRWEGRETKQRTNGCRLNAEGYHISCTTCRCPEMLRSFQSQVQNYKYTFSQPFQDKCISEVARIGSIIIFNLSKLWKARFFILMCNISGEAAEQIWNWSLLEVEGLILSSSLHSPSLSPSARTVRRLDRYVNKWWGFQFLGKQLCNGSSIVCCTYNRSFFVEIIGSSSYCQQIYFSLWVWFSPQSTLKYLNFFVPVPICQQILRLLFF